MSSKSVQDIISALNAYWAQQGCLLIQPFDMEVGAGTSHPATYLRAIGPEPWCAAYVQGSRRPKDGRYGQNPNRLQHYYQYQVVLKPSPLAVQDLYIDSLRALGIDPLAHDIRFVEDNWENPSLGASGLGWEVWLDGMEITQFTYFQKMGSFDCKPVMSEITYGIERLAMYLQGVENVYELLWGVLPNHRAVSYGDIYQENEQEQSTYNFECANIEELFRLFNYYESEAQSLLKRPLVIPAYEMILKAGHAFNLLEARRAISTTERANYIARLRALSRSVAKAYYDRRECLDFPLCRSPLESKV